MKSSLEEVLEREVAEIPFRLMEALVRRKLTEAGVPKPRKLATKIVERLRAGEETAELRFEDEGPEDREVAITFTAEDFNEITTETQRIVEETMPGIIEDAREDGGKSLAKRLVKNWPEQQAWQAETTAEFKERLEERWGRAFDYLRMLITASRELGGELHARNSKARGWKKRRHLIDAMTRLHTRGCQVATEVMTLMENGFADGAMARWRTLYEIGVVASLLAAHGEELAQRYLEHVAVEEKRALDLYAKCHLELGFAPYDKRSVRRINARFEAAKAKYGAPFCEAHGWAAHHLKISGRQFSDLEAAAGRASMRSYYKMASYNVHAGTKGILFRLGLFRHDGYLAGASNIGFVDPAQNTAYSLTEITGYIFLGKLSLEEQIKLRALVELRDLMLPALAAADRKLRRDEKRLQRPAPSKSST